jgi:hypothetical protein
MFNRPLTLLLFPLLFVVHSFSPEWGVDVGWAPVSSGYLGAYNLRCGLQGEGKRIAISVVGKCR